MIVDDTSVAPPLLSSSTSSVVPEVSVSVRHIGKMYRIYDRPQDRLKQMLWRGQRMYGREFWALREVSFEAHKGETLGIIGRNGSGKSTLLQIIAGTLAPTTGEVVVNGRVAALLELGSGFNPEFTGRENVYLNGAILGLSHEQIQERFDQIAAFADIGEFIDQPVKTYSSGMLVRLAFAVQANVEPDVLIVDEALAVGDVFFRQKCYRRLAELRARGTTILVVSHAMTDIEQFCQRAILLDHGAPIFQGASSEAVKRYYLIEQQDRRPIQDSTAREVPPHPIPLGQEEFFWPAPEAFLDISGVVQVSNGWARCTGIALCDRHGRPCYAFQQGETASFFYGFELLQDTEVPIGGIVLQNAEGVIVHGKSTLEYGSEVPGWGPSGSRLRFRQDITLELAVGEYTFEVGLAMMPRYDYDRRRQYAHADLIAKYVRLCHLPSVAQFAVVFRHDGAPVQLLHHGIANLPGACTMIVDGASEAST